MFSYYQERCPQETSWLLPETCKYKLLLGNMTTITLLRPLRLFPNTGKKTQKRNSTADYKKQQQKFWTTPRWPFHWDTIIYQATETSFYYYTTTKEEYSEPPPTTSNTKKNSRVQQQQQYNNNNTTTTKQHSESCLLPTSGTQSLARPLRLVPITNTRSAVLAQAFAYII